MKFSNIQNLPNWNCDSIELFFSFDQMNILQFLNSMIQICFSHFQIIMVKSNVMWANDLAPSRGRRHSLATNLDWQFSWDLLFYLIDTLSKHSQLFRPMVKINPHHLTMLFSLTISFLSLSHQIFLSRSSFRSLRPNAPSLPTYIDFIQKPHDSHVLIIID